LTSLSHIPFRRTKALFDLGHVRPHLQSNIYGALRKAVTSRNIHLNPLGQSPPSTCTLTTSISTLSSTNGITIFSSRVATYNIHSCVGLPTVGSGVILSPATTKFPPPSPRRDELPTSKKHVGNLGAGPGLWETALIVQWTRKPAHQNGKDGCRGKAHNGTITHPAEHVEACECVPLCLG
jgi:hypothetical protein